MTAIALPGLHHVTAIASDAQRNVDFYAGALGLRLVKKTINFDDPGTYHLYYGDALGRPGTILTFFPWPGARAGRHGRGEAVMTTLQVPEGALAFWRERLTAHGIENTNAFREDFGEEVIAFRDPDGMGMELLARGDSPPAPGGATDTWAGATVPGEFAIRGMDGVTLQVAQREATEQALTETLGFAAAAGENGGAEDRLRFHAPGGEGALGTRLDLLIRPEIPMTSLGAGIVHHIAWRTTDDASQQQWQETLTRSGFHVSPVRDRSYFHSIYFREPGGVLFEIATDPPGFTADETQETLGSRLCLPAAVEAQRTLLEQALPVLRVPGI